MYCILKCIKFNQAESRIRNREFFNFARHFIIINRKGRDYLNFEKPVSDLSVLKEWNKQEIKSVHIENSIKQSGLKMSSSKVPSSENLE